MAKGRLHILLSDPLIDKLQLQCEKLGIHLNDNAYEHVITVLLTSFCDSNALYEHLNSAFKEIKPKMLEVKQATEKKDAVV